MVTSGLFSCEFCFASYGLFAFLRVQFTVNVHEAVTYANIYCSFVIDLDDILEYILDVGRLE